MLILKKFFIRARSILFQKRNPLISQRKDWKTIVEFRACKFWAGPDNKIESVLLQNNEKYDVCNFSAIEKLVNSDDVCFDIGANIGVYSTVLSRLSGDDSNVHSFEPVSHIRKRLTMNAKLNGFGNINVNDFALGAAPETIYMNQIKEGVFRGGTSSFLKNENWQSLTEDDFETVPVDVKTLDAYLADKKLEKVNFLKIDVEGFEWNVLQGAQKTLQTFKPHILMEYDFERHNEEQSPEAYKSFFEDLGYKAYEFTIGGGELFLLPYKFEHTPINRNILCLHPDVSEQGK